VARVAYYWKTGEATVLHVEQAMPIVVATVAVTAGIGAVAAASLWLTFFPTPRYLRWVEGSVRGTRAGTSTSLRPGSRA
jgi:hypothetical protein